MNTTPNLKNLQNLGKGTLQNARRQLDRLIITSDRLGAVIANWHDSNEATRQADRRAQEWDAKRKVKA